MLNKFKLFFNTVKYLKFIQIYYQIFYRIRKPKSLVFYSSKYRNLELNYLNFKNHFEIVKYLKGEHTFTFLNLTKSFPNKTEWDFDGFGKLWNYNLQYFNYLDQEDLDLDKMILLILDFNSAIKHDVLKLEPYPTSLRIINTIRFCSKHRITNNVILRDLYGQCVYLNENYEYHILGNHLLENAFAMIMAGKAFNNILWLNRAKNILIRQLKEQIQDDGGHFELSPMYHKIILFRVLELIEWYRIYEQKDINFLLFLERCAKSMLFWLKTIVFDDGSIPHFNDSANGIALEANELFLYAHKLGFDKIIEVKLSQSGYRKFKSNLYDCRIDIGPVGASYQPGHSHADALSFILYYRSKPFLVEAGTSTYQIGKRRDYERSTAAHNTVLIGGKDQSEVWGGFRVGRRANVSLVYESESKLVAQHDGYELEFGLLHERAFEFSDYSILLEDRIGNGVGRFLLHFHPDCNVYLSTSNSVIIENIGEIIVEKPISLILDNYEYANGYNTYIRAKMLAIEFSGVLKSQINFIE